MTGDAHRTMNDHNTNADPPMTRTKNQEQRETTANAPTVLVVEDEPDVADMYSEWLRDSFAVEIVHTGDEALDRVDGSVDVVLLDRRLPDTSGRTVLEEIRNRDLPCQVVVVSAVDPGVDVLDAGFDDYITKPTSEADLTAAVERSITRMTYTTTCQEFMALAGKLATLEANMDVEELEACQAYTERRARFAEMADELGAISVGDEEYRDLYQTKLTVLLENTRAPASNY